MTWVLSAGNQSALYTGLTELAVLLLYSIKYFLTDDTPKKTLGGFVHLTLIDESLTLNCTPVHVCNSLPGEKTRKLNLTRNLTNFTVFPNLYITSYI